MDRVGLTSGGARSEAEKRASAGKGYCRIDTAMYYHNEEDVGAGIRACGIRASRLLHIGRSGIRICGGRQEETFYKSSALGTGLH